MHPAIQHRCSASDLEFRRRFERCDVPLREFAHRDHIRLAYVYLAENDADLAIERMREALRRFIGHYGIDPAKYHETITQAWILATDHFMHTSPTAASADEFIAAHPMLLRKQIMLTHYSEALLFSSFARATFVEPDIAQIPRHMGLTRQAPSAP
jgi:hypothetical protein